MGAFARLRLRNGLVAATVLGLAISAGRPASAEVTISGTPDAVRIEASNATLEEVLSGLRERFDLTYQSAARLDRRIDGKYAGQLSGVVKRLLGAYDFVLKHENEALSLRVTAESRSTVQPSPRPVTAESKATAQPGPQLASVGPNSNLPGQSRPPDPSPVTAQLQTQLDHLLSSRTAGVTTQPPATTGSAPRQPATMAEMMQRANASLQSLWQALRAVQR